MRSSSSLLRAHPGPRPDELPWLVERLHRGRAVVSLPDLAGVVLLLMVVVGVAPAPVARLQPAYTFTELGTLNGSESGALGINAAGCSTTAFSTGGLLGAA